ncbi:MAG: sigma-70 family RNA polymerase sigma factor [Rhodospirillales bacterium]|jgi:RNA polymerase sigma-70 factor (ECF subfamily)|nr:sigma-70 family RNA polymerase sigma factor [Rhodospirillales bacterium]
MRAAQAGDRARYAALLKAVLPPLRRAARARWPRAGAAEIEDVVQETLLALHASRHLYDPERPFMPFLFGILRFRGADVMRRTHRNMGRETNIDDVPETSGALATNSKVEEGLDAVTLRAALSQLPPGQRQALELTKLQEMSLEEASAASGMSVVALKVATHRGIKALRKLLDGSG